MPQKSVRINDFSLISRWTNSGGAFSSQPTTDTQTQTFALSGIPEGSTAQTAVFSASFGSPYTGADTLQVNGVSVGFDQQTVSLAPIAGGNGTYSVTFTFRAIGKATDTDGSHYGVVVVSNPTVTVTYTVTEEEEEKEEEIRELAENTARQIVVFSPTETNFADNGLAVLSPSAARVHEVAGGSFDLTLTHPFDPYEKWKLLTEGALIRSPVPEKIIPSFTVPAASVWQVTSETAPLYSVLPSYTKAQTPVDDIIAVPARFEWSGSKPYETGDYAVWNNGIYVATQDNQGVNPSFSGGIWSWVCSITGGGGTPGTIYDPGVVAETLQAGEMVTFAADYNATYMLVRSLRGITGYVRRSDCALTESGSGKTTVPEKHITAQVFRVYHVTVDAAAQTVTVNASHISYDFGKNALYDCQIIQADPATAIAIMQGATVQQDSRTIASPLEEPLIDADWSWQNPIAALLDPETGLAAKLQAQVIRDNRDFYLLSNASPVACPALRYGVNLKGVSWERDEDVITRIIPRGQDAEGNTLLLPELFVDSDLINDYPVVGVEPLSCDVKVGETVKLADGTEHTRTLDDCFSLMRQAAQNRFDVDKVDAVGVRLRVDFLLVGDSEEYSQYKGLQAVHLYDQIPVLHIRAGLNASAQVTEYEWDPLIFRYVSVILGDVLLYKGRTVAGYNLTNGAVTFDKLAVDVARKIRSIS